MQLFIRTLDGSHLALHLREQDTVEHLQQALEVRHIAPLDLLRSLQSEQPLT